MAEPLAYDSSRRVGRVRIFAGADMVQVVLPTRLTRDLQSAFACLCCQPFAAYYAVRHIQNNGFEFNGLTVAIAVVWSALLGAAVIGVLFYFTSRQRLLINDRGIVWSDAWLFGSHEVDLPWAEIVDVVPVYRDWVGLSDEREEPCVLIALRSSFGLFQNRERLLLGGRRNEIVALMEIISTYRGQEISCRAGLPRL